ncbi:MAG: DDE-type integrase/transposase/recombinase, partial [Desulfobacterales bacterium]|nr:DDE-type integrase/transposase/recombinase [Desulfobacterales bacterium]
LLQIKARRIERWAMRMKVSGSMEYARPGPKRAFHSIMPPEREALMEFIGQEETVDYSLQAISIKGAEQDRFYMSASSVRTILHNEGLAADRNLFKRRRGGISKPNRPDELTGPNQCWCWDISYLKTDILRTFWYLYVMLDEWSRKVVAWRVSKSLAHEESKALIDDAFIAESLIDKPEDEQPVVVNDRGAQMKAVAVKQMFKDLGIFQTFSRPRTPNDNPFIESLFSTVKRSPVYTGWFPIDDEAYVLGYFNQFFNWYNHEHYHSRIGYVPPFKKHEGIAEGILEERKMDLAAQREIRKDYWLSQQLTGNGL